ncbi:hypothetical protein Tco_0391074 [Tanacetum coccineum]
MVRRARVHWCLILLQKIKSMDGKILGKDGEPTIAQRCVRFSNTNKKETWDGAQVANIGVMETAVPLTNIHTSHVSTVSNMDVHSVHQNETKYEGVTELNLGVIHVAIKEGVVVRPFMNMDAVDEIRARLVNTLYGSSVGKRLAFPMVKNYVKHAWAKLLKIGEEKD